MQFISRTHVRLFSIIIIIITMTFITITPTSVLGTRALSHQEKMNAYRKRVAKKFMMEKAKKPGVIRLPSGLLFEWISPNPYTFTSNNTNDTNTNNENHKRSPGPNDECEVHYTGSLPDGNIFDNSHARGAPSHVTPTQVIPAWGEALRLMQAGDEWRIYAPYELAYGARGAGGKIPPFSPLIFEMKLIKIKGKASGRTMGEVGELLRQAERDMGWAQEQQQQQQQQQQNNNNNNKEEMTASEKEKQEKREDQMDM